MEKLGTETQEATKKETGKSRADRVRSLLASMTLEEKIAQVCALWLQIEENGSFVIKNLSGATPENSHADPSLALRNGIGQLTRPMGTRPIDARRCLRGLNLIQKHLVERTRLGIPAIAHEECLPGLMAQDATLFPTGINYGSLWDPELMHKIGQAIGEELFSVGSRQGLAPVLDVCRDARWGRVEETLGEDPYLVGSLATAYVKGFQGPDRRLLATLKHFVGHSASEGGRNHAPVHVGPLELLDTFLLPFEMAVRLGNAGSLMPAYHDVDGEPASSSTQNITTLLRDKWGFDGIVVSDYEAIIQLLNDHGTAHDIPEAAAQSLRAGIDMELPSMTVYGTGIADAIKRGDLEPAVLDAAVSRVLNEKIRLGLFENPYADEGAVALNTPHHREVALEAARKSMVLLKNDGTLPLKKGPKVALIGPLADEPLAVYAGYSFPVHLITAARQLNTPPPKTLTVREAIAAQIPASDILYARGCDILTERPKHAPVFPGEIGKVEAKSYISHDRSRFDEAIACAKKADRIVLAVGDLSGLFQSGTVGEGSDVSSLRLPGVQQDLLDALTELGKPIAVVLVSGRPYSLGTSLNRVNAVLEAWLPGQEGAQAIAETLFGENNPGGKLPVSFPKSGGALPFYYNHKFKSSGTPVQQEFGADFPFGHGLSYTSFTYDSFKVGSARVGIDGTITVSCRVRNTGRQEGSETVQVYVRDLVARFVRPVMELKAFKRFSLEAGKAATVSFAIPVDMLNYAIDGTERIVEPGDFEIMLGASSDDIRFRTRVTVEGKEKTLGRDWRMSSQASVSEE